MHSQWNVTIAAHGMWHILMKWAPSSQHGSQWQMFIKQRKEKAKPWNPYKPRADFSPLHFQSDKCSKPPRGHSSSNPVGRKEESVLSLILPNTLQNEINLFLLQGRRHQNKPDLVSLATLQSSAKASLNFSILLSVQMLQKKESNF